MPRPTKFRPKRQDNLTVRAAREKALTRLENLWKQDNEGGEWEPESEPIVTPMLRSVDGGVEHCVQALRAHDDDDARSFIEVWDRCTQTDRKHLCVEEIAHAAGVGSLRLAEVCQSALFLYGDMQTQMMLSAGLPQIVATSIKQAKKPKGYADREWMLKAGKIIPIPKGSQTAIQFNAGEARGDKGSEGGHEWKYPEDRTKAIMAVINPKQLESGTLSTDHPRHFNQNAPIVFER